jgi:RimJ/RimL family protein N-acetyltransferase
MKSPVLGTERLVLRRWTSGDRELFAQINGDPKVMQYRLRTLTRQESDALMDAIETCFDEHGFGQWAVERREDGRLIGFIGLEVAKEDVPFRPLVHIGWHLAVDAWHHGYATEGAGAVLDFAFDEVGLAEVVANTTTRNERSQAVMRRLGMTHNPADDFDAPWYPPGHPNRRFVVYRLTAVDWRRRRSSCIRELPDDDLPFGQL